MNDSNYIKIYTGDIMIVQRIVSELKELNIIPVVKDQTDSGLLPVFGTSNSIFKQIYIHKDEIEKASPVMDVISSELQE